MLENALPYKLNTDKLADNIEYLISIYGKLASYVYRQSTNNKNPLSIGYERIKIISKLPPEKSRNIL